MYVKCAGKLLALKQGLTKFKKNIIGGNRECEHVMLAPILLKKFSENNRLVKPHLFQLVHAPQTALFALLNL